MQLLSGPLITQEISLKMRKPLFTPDTDSLDTFPTDDSSVTTLNSSKVM